MESSKKSRKEVVNVSDDLMAYYKPAVKFYEMLLGWKMKEVDEDSKKDKKIQTSSQFKNNQG
jgi:predicted enzyme related to lactoylglutathione lyase